LAQWTGTPTEAAKAAAGDSSLDRIMATGRAVADRRTAAASPPTVPAEPWPYLVGLTWEACVTSDVDARKATGSYVDAPARGRRRTFARAHRPVLAVVSVGGGLGAVARYGLSELLPTLPGQFPWATS
jgi:hypothetical protein